MKLSLLKLFKHGSLLILFLGVCVALTGTSVAQNQYYVSPTGNDANDGSSARPWRTIGHAASALTLGQGGAVVNVAAGDYGCVDTERTGSASQPIVYKSTTPHGAKITCGTSAGVAWFNGANAPSPAYVTIQGFEVTGTGTLCEGIKTYGTHNNILQNYVHDIPSPTTSCGSGIGGAGIHTSGTSLTYNTNDTVIGNVIDNVGFASGSCSTQHGIYIGSQQVIVENNIVSRACGWGIHMFHQTTNNVISNNTVLNNLRGGILVVGSDGVTADSTTVINNIVVSNGGTENGIEERWGLSGSNNVYRNNLVVNNSPANFSFSNGDRTTTGNVCNVAGPGCQTVISSSQANVANIFVNYTGNAMSGDYNLKAGSVAIGTGATGECAPGGISPCTPKLDFALLSVSSPLDIGALGQGTTASAPSAPTNLTALVQ